MAAPGIPPIRLGLIGTGLAVEKLHWPALRGLADRYTVTAFTDPSDEQCRRFTGYSGVDPALATAGRAALLARDDVDAVLVSVPIPHLYEVARDALAAGKDVFCEKPAGVDAQQAAAFLALAAGHPDRTFVVGENHFYRDDLRYARALLDDGAIGRLHLMAWRHAVRSVPRPGNFTATPWRHRPQYRGGVHLDAGVHHIAQIRLLCGDIAWVHGAVQTANSTIDAPSDLTLNLVFAGGAIGNYTASYAEIPVPPEPNEMRLYGTEGVLVLAGSEAERRVTRSSSDATTHTTVFRGIDNGYRAELVDFADAVQFGARPTGSVAQSVANAMVVQRAFDSAERAAVLALGRVPGAGPVPLWRPRGSTGLFDGLPGQRISSSASFAA
ncbi:Gfo/Idh/MocA family protein [Amycolatopsis vancoresmycina]|uniref:Oxidoreductase domain-containing protein n=1 Tax=Amycolatopsis vancoresmycina DSM 44592 TaxID=1292037 RepID=R1I4G5_9PSEU|nr:Gfo/Idh/MocA family oxidoreductase [Amycolatopsis vancoresmycina]EOD67401.1 oxidoreductase domain-containing protein [Amycolatopsis vancoresmycina DSM 44592]